MDGLEPVTLVLVVVGRDQLLGDVMFVVYFWWQIDHIYLLADIEGVDVGQLA